MMVDLCGHIGGQNSKVWKRIELVVSHDLIPCPQNSSIYAIPHWLLGIMHLRSNAVHASTKIRIRIMIIKRAYAYVATLPSKDR